MVIRTIPVLLAMLLVLSAELCAGAQTGGPGAGSPDPGTTGTASTGIGVTGAGSNGARTTMTKIRLVFENREVIVRMHDNPASHDFLALLPLTVQFKDFAATEKIAYLPRKLILAGSPTARQEKGDFAYYAPWGNLAVFYQGSGTDGQLYSLGTIESGKKNLSLMKDDFTARIEIIE